jgi:putative DNA methylase
MEPTALETCFPAAVVNATAEAESWRKEVHRPATHTHKWWAQRLGTVFRGLLTSALVGSHDAAVDAFCSAFRAPGLVVYDPFAGSGTTVVEAIKLGCKAIGQDINPVATLVQRQAVAKWDPQRLHEMFRTVERAARPEIDALHQTADGDPVLYYFWVAQAPCRACPNDAPLVDLFSSYVFAKHAYPKKHPRAQAVCPACGAIQVVHAIDDHQLTCAECGQMNSLTGPVSGRSMWCRNGHSTNIMSSLGSCRPSYRMYAKLVLRPGRIKSYERITQFDLDLYEKSSKLLAERSTDLLLPQGELAEGYNTRQAMSWNFIRWEDFFNDRQLYSLGVLGTAVKNLPAGPEREALAALFSGTLEFNNLFCSFKGEGTGAVRHMFSHHILKPERAPLEAHPWGTPASSGSFSTLYKSRILRALEYKLAPHDIVGRDQGSRITGLSEPLSVPVFTDMQELLTHDGPAAMLVTGSSASANIPDEAVDIVLTDPPFFDNVHYSELADFFHAWLAPLSPYTNYPSNLSTTRSSDEVQHTDAEAFGTAIGAVWQECARVLKKDGLLAFTFHQSKIEGWLAVINALRSASFVITAIQPVKAEMSTASPKSKASDPSNLDAVVVCRLDRSLSPPTVDNAIRLLGECADSGVIVGFADIQSVVWGTILARSTWDIDANLNDFTVEAVQAVEHACEVMGVASARPLAKS